MSLSATEGLDDAVMVGGAVGLVLVPTVGLEVGAIVLLVGLEVGANVSAVGLDV